MKNILIIVAAWGIGIPLGSKWNISVMFTGILCVGIASLLLLVFGDL